jgi:hypothetical protein
MKFLHQGPVHLFRQVPVIEQIERSNSSEVEGPAVGSFRMTGATSSLRGKFELLAVINRFRFGLLVVLQEGRYSRLPITL